MTAPYTITASRDDHAAWRVGPFDSIAAAQAAARRMRAAFGAAMAWTVELRDGASVPIDDAPPP